MIPPTMTPTFADQRRADLRSWASACCAPVRRAGRRVAAVREAVSRLRTPAPAVR